MKFCIKVGNYIVTVKQNHVCGRKEHMNKEEFDCLEKLYRHYRFMSQETLLDELVEITFKYNKLCETIESFDRREYSDAMYKLKKNLEYEEPVTWKDRVKDFWGSIFSKSSKDYIRQGMLQTGIPQAKKLSLWQRFIGLFKKSEVVVAKEQFTSQEMRKLSKEIKQAVLK